MGQCMKDPKKKESCDQGIKGMLGEESSQMSPPLQFPPESNQIGHIPQLPQYKIKVISDVQESGLLQYRAKPISDAHRLSGIQKQNGDRIETDQEILQGNTVKLRNMRVSQPIQIFSRYPAQPQIKESHLQASSKSIPSKVRNSPSEIIQNLPIYEQTIPQASQSADIISKETSLFKSDNPKGNRASPQEARARDGLLKSSIEFNMVKKTIDAKSNAAQQSSLKTNVNNFGDTHQPSFSQLASKVASQQNTDGNKPKANQRGYKIPRSQINNRQNHSNL